MSASRMWPAIALVAALLGSGCDNLGKIEDEGCGNRVINEDEDCDGPTTLVDGATCGERDSVNACFFVCEDGAICPDGWSCGADLRCRRPSGAFVEQQGGSLVADEMAVADVDGDGLLDLAGSANTAVSIRYGDGLGGFREGFDQALPVPTGPVAFGRFSGDERLDLVVPIFAGFFSLLGTETRTLEPFNYAPFVLPPLDAGPPAIFPGHGRVLALDAVIEPAGTPSASEALLLLDDHSMLVEFADPNPMMHGMPNQRLSIDLTRQLGSADLDGDGTTEVVLTYVGSDIAYFYSADGLQDLVAYPATSQGASQVMMPRDTPTAPRYQITDPGNLFADLDGDGDLDLLVSVVPPGGGAGHVAVALQDAQGAFASEASLVHPLDIGECLGLELGDPWPESPWPLAAADLDGDGLTDYVFEWGIAMARDPDAMCPYGRLRLVSEPVGSGAWDHVLLVDINADRALDVAAASDVFSGVDIMLNAFPAGQAIFSPFHIGSAGPTKALRAGDFNGDLVSDLIYIENGQERRPDRLYTVYGAYAGGPSESVDMGAIGVVESVAAGSTMQGLNGQDLAADLAVLLRPFLPEDAQAEARLSIAVVFGDSSRKMVSPFIVPHRDEMYPIATVIGNFGSPERFRMVDGKDVAVILANGPIDRPIISMVAGVGDQGDAYTQLDYAGALPTIDVFNSWCALWTAGPLAPQGMSTDALIGVDLGPQCGRTASFRPRILLADRLDASLFPNGPPPPPVPPPNIADLSELPVAEIPFDVTDVRRVALEDVDADGALDLMVVLDLYDGSSAILVLRNSDACGGARLCAAESMVISSTGVSGPGTTYQAFLDAAPIQLDTDPRPELAVLTDRGIIALGWDEASGQYQYLACLDGDCAGQDTDDFGHLRAADVDNDGVADLVVNNKGRLRILMHTPARPFGDELAKHVEDAP